MGGSKVVLLLSFFVFSCVAGLMASSYAADNVINNPGFEGQGSWNVWGKEEWKRDVSSSEEKHEGSKSYKVIIGSADAWDSTIAEQIIYGVPAEGSFEGSVWVKVPAKTPLVNTLVYLEVWLIKEDGSEYKKYQSVQLDNQAVPDWQKLTVSGTIPSEVKSMKYWLVIAPQKGDCAGTVYFDDAVLTITSP